MTPRTRGILSIVLVILGLTAGVGSLLTNGPSTPRQVGAALPTFFAVDYASGGLVAVDQLARGKPAVLSFWSVRCQECKAQLEVLDSLAGRHLGRLGVFAINVDTSSSTVSDSMGQHRALGVYSLFERTQEAKALLGLDGTPFWVLVSGDGRVAGIGRGLGAFSADAPLAHVLDSVLAL